MTYYNDIVVIENGEDKQKKLVIVVKQILRGLF